MTMMPNSPDELKCWFYDICNDCNPPAYKCHFEAVIQGAVPCNECPEKDAFIRNLIPQAVAKLAVEALGCVPDKES